MSPSRRSGHEDSILARLDKDPGGRGATGARLAWYGTAALIAVGLTATLAWLAAGTGEPALEIAQAREARTHGTAPAAASEPDLPAAPPESAPAFAPASAQPAAVIVDAPAPPDLPAATPPAPSSPSLRLLEPATAPAVTAATDDSPKIAVKPPPQRGAALPKPRPQAARPAPRPSVRTPRAGDTADDSDVALISAVIYHANGHAGGAQASPACVDDACRERANRP